MIEEQSHIVEEEQRNSQQYKSLMLLAQSTFKTSLFQTQNNQEM